MVKGATVSSFPLCFCQVSRPRAAEPCAASLWFGGKDPGGCRDCRPSALPGWTSSATQRPVLETPLPGLGSLCAVQRLWSPGEVHTKHSNTTVFVFLGFLSFTSTAVQTHKKFALIMFLLKKTIVVSSYIVHMEINISLCLSTHCKIFCDQLFTPFTFVMKDIWCIGMN